MRTLVTGQGYQDVGALLSLSWSIEKYTIFILQRNNQHKFQIFSGALPSCIGNGWWWLRSLKYLPGDYGINRRIYGSLYQRQYFWGALSAFAVNWHWGSEVWPKKIINRYCHDKYETASRLEVQCTKATLHVCAPRSKLTLDDFFNEPAASLLPV